MTWHRLSKRNFDWLHSRHMFNKRQSSVHFGLLTSVPRSHNAWLPRRKPKTENNNNYIEVEFKAMLLFASKRCSSTIHQLSHFIMNTRSAVCVTIYVLFMKVYEEFHWINVLIIKPWKWYNWFLLLQRNVPSYISVKLLIQFLLVFLSVLSL